MYSFYIECYAYSLLWAGYYTYYYSHWLTTKAKDDTNFFTKAKSEYFTKVVDSPDLKPRYQIRWDRVKVVLVRTVCQTIADALVIATFYCGAMSKTNNGVIDTLFTTQLIFTTAFFYFKYDQKITKMDFAGIILIVLCVVSIAYGSSLDKESDHESLTKDQLSELSKEKDDRHFYLALAIVFACLSGMALSVNVTSLKVVHDSGMNHIQANYDCSFLMFLILLPFYLYSVFVDKFVYSFQDVFFQVLVTVLVIFSNVILSLALQYGKGGPVNAIKQSSTIIHTIEVIIFRGILPNWLQWIGVCLGFTGVLLIVLQKKPSAVLNLPTYIKQKQTLQVKINRFKKSNSYKKRKFKANQTY